MEGILGFTSGLLACAVILLLGWGLSLRRKLAIRPSAKHYTIHLDGSKFFADIDQAEVSHLVRDKLTDAATKAAERFSHDLGETVPKLVEDINKLNAAAFHAEFEKSQVSLKNLNNEILQEHAALQQEVTARRKDLLDALDKEIVAQYKARLQQFDARFNDIVSSYIVESLGKGADLGAQSSYLMQQLEAQKEQIKKDIAA